MKTKKIPVFALIFALIGACESPKSPQTQQEMSSDSLSLQLERLTKDFEAVWAVLESSDKSKLDNIKLLVEHIKKTKQYNKSLLDSMPLFEQNAINAQFDHLTMADSKKIDDYDQSIEQLISAARRLTQSSPEAQNLPQCQELLENISNSYNKDVFYRKEYDDLVNQYNQILKTNAATLKKLGGKYAQYQPLPLFTVSL